MPFFATSLLSNPATIAALVLWIAVSVLLAILFGWKRGPITWQETLIILAFLIFGLAFFPVWLVVGALARSRQEGTPFHSALAGHLMGRGREKSPEEDVSYVIYDVHGKALRTDNRSSRAATGIKITNKLIRNAIKQVASDVLIHPVSDDQFNVRYRVHGSLRNICELSRDEGKSVVNSLKAISGMDIAERRRPQEGGFTAKTLRGPVKFRVATAGTLNGEKVSVRVLHQSAAAFTLESIGMLGNEIKSVMKAIAGQSGLILVCGPTGSGKSTTVHAMLRTIDRMERNVITIEDPIEYVLPNASQIEINKKAGITFAATLNSVLRQDPDVIFVGEIRDSETAEAALQAAQTGHLVFATLDSNSNPAAILRLIELGCDSQLVASALHAVISQRLVRRLCDHCKRRESFSDDEKAELWKQTIDPDCLFAPKGCKHCHRVGYGGRTGAFDIMMVNRDMRNQIAAEQVQVTDFGHVVDAGGVEMTALQVRVTQLAMGGWTSWAEVQRVATTME